MQVIINIPNNFSEEKAQEKIKAIEKKLEKEASYIQRKKDIKNDLNNDPWSNPNIDLPSIDTGIEDLAENHDHYLYGLPKQP
ncbi:MAG TPA: hypothetical protein VJL89_02830 [Thermodesulfovibrionia bacterium]|nr:hypothetical protein [Thermodesulfovibrionia bacterium]